MKVKIEVSEILCEAALTYHYKYNPDKCANSKKVFTDIVRDYIKEFGLSKMVEHLYLLENTNYPFIIKQLIKDYYT